MKNLTLLNEDLWIIPSTKSPNEFYKRFDPNGVIRIPLYTLIFICGLVGNSLVIATLVRNRRLRIVTNIFLLNLAVSDLLLGVFCMPFTLIGTLRREFIFGETMCRIIPYFQGVSVAVNAWTLVAISLERYYAVCEPLKSRRWQTTCHAYRILLLIWTFSMILMSPVAFLSRLLPMELSDKYKCRENWPNEILEGGFNICLDIFLLILPLGLMATVYGKIAVVLKQGIVDSEKCAKKIARTSATGFYNCVNPPIQDCISGEPPKMIVKWNRTRISTGEVGSSDTYRDWYSKDNGDMRTNNIQHRLAVKNRVIRMLFVVVLEYFICWTPVYVINTVSVYVSGSVYDSLGQCGISFFHLLSYTSSCCNPLTYCFVNKNFRREFLQTFRKPCGHKKQIICRRGPLDTTLNGNVHPSRVVPIETLVLSSRQL
ncbi:cholecystokinin receptor-like isoform X2 [Centruroides vittatus]|uniref:cholecystokinin receptor-like isoform X2 n=1 Tax=Centruroides vittatus TaxID=120091 RepID=UPI00350EF1AF